MKKTIVSLAAASLLAGSVMAADNGVDIKTSGQAVVYVQTTDNAGANTLGDKASSVANFGVQLDFSANLGNDFGLGSQLTYLGTAGLETSIVDNVAQTNTGNDELALTKIFVTKKIANTTLKAGRQELPKSLSPLAYSEGWNVFKNTFDAVLAINTDIPNTTLVAALVGGSNSSKDIGAWTPLTAAGTTVNGAQMLTAQTTAIPMATVTASYYNLGTVAAATNEGASAMWVDAKIADKSLPMGLKIGIQGGQIAPASSALKATTAYGAKLGLSPVDGLNVCLAYTAVDDGSVAVKNTGTGVKTPLYTQMVLNQNHIASDNSTMMAKVSYKMGESTITLRGTQTTDNAAANSDFTDIEAIYTTKLLGAKLFAAYVYTDDETLADAQSTVRVWGRYAF